VRDFVNNRWFALTEIFLVLASGLILYLRPGAGGWSLILPLLPWCLRLIFGQFPFQRTIFDWLIVIFIITAVVGYWAAYDKEAALPKFWLILLGILFYYALTRQPRENLSWLSGIFFSISIGISLYFFLTHDFVALPRTSVREYDWTLDHAGETASPMETHPSKLCIGNRGDHRALRLLSAMEIEESGW
jgi:hypothetical protein